MHASRPRAASSCLALAILLYVAVHVAAAPATVYGLLHQPDYESYEVSYIASALRPSGQTVRVETPNEDDVDAVFAACQRLQKAGASRIFVWAYYSDFVSAVNDFALATPSVKVTFLQSVCPDEEGRAGNVECAAFRLDELGFLAGVYAASMGVARIGMLAYERSDVGMLTVQTAFRKGVEVACVQAACVVTPLWLAATPADATADSVQRAADAALAADVQVLYDADFATWAGVTASSSAAARGVNVIESGIDEYYSTFLGGAAPGADRLLSSIVLLYDAAARALARRPFTGGLVRMGLAEGAIASTPCYQSCARIPFQTPAAIEKYRRLLAAGQMRTGVDAETGLPTPWPVGLLLAPGTALDDTVYMQNIWQNALTGLGVQRFVATAASAAEADVEAAVRALLAQGVRQVLTASFDNAFTATLYSCARAHFPPSLLFTFIDHGAPGEGPNVEGLGFADGEVGFLAGVLAGSASAPRARTVGIATGPTAVLAVRRAAAGFGRGVAYACPDCTVLTRNVGSFFDRAAGAAAGEALAAAGADVVFGCGGSTGSAAILAAAARAAPVLVIGIDADEYATTFAGGAAPGARMLLGTALKRIETAVRRSLAWASVGQFRNGTSRMGAAGGAADVAWTPVSPAGAAVRTAVARARDALAVGGLHTGVAYDTGALGFLWSSPAQVGETVGGLPQALGLYALPLMGADPAALSPASAPGVARVAPGGTLTAAFAALGGQAAVRVEAACLPPSVAVDARAAVAAAARSAAVLVASAPAAGGKVKLQVPSTSCSTLLILCSPPAAGGAGPACFAAPDAVYALAAVCSTCGPAPKPLTPGTVFGIVLCAVFGVCWTGSGLALAYQRLVAARVVRPLARLAFLLPDPPAPKAPAPPRPAPAPAAGVGGPGRPVPWQPLPGLETPLRPLLAEPVATPTPGGAGPAPATPAASYEVPLTPVAPPRPVPPTPPAAQLPPPPPARAAPPPVPPPAPRTKDDII